MNPFYVLQSQSSGTDPEWRDRETFGREKEAFAAFIRKCKFRDTNEQSRAAHWRLVERTQKILAET